MTACVTSRLGRAGSGKRDPALEAVGPAGPHQIADRADEIDRGVTHCPGFPDGFDPRRKGTLVRSPVSGQADVPDLVNPVLGYNPSYSIHLHYVPQSPSLGDSVE